VLACIESSENIDEEDDDDVSPEVKAEREKQRRKQNNARERFVSCCYILRES